MPRKSSKKATAGGGAGVTTGGGGVKSTMTNPLGARLGKRTAKTGRSGRR